MWEPKSAKADYPGTVSEGLASFTLDEKRGFIDTSGRVVIEARFERARRFSEGFAAVQLNGKWSFIDKAGLPAWR